MSIDIAGNPIVPDGYSPVAPGKLAVVVTALEMLERPARDAVAPLLERVEAPETGWYRDLYRRIGENWMWSSRLAMTDARLAGTIAPPATEIYTRRENGRDIALVELNLRVAGEVELAFFGLAPEAVGKGLGSRLLAEAIDRAWRPGIRRVWVHTCTLDHAAALGVYRRAGFVPFARFVEVFEDPRLAGTLPMTAAPQVPIIP